MDSCQSALDVLKKTSRTFYIPISRLPAELLEAVSSAYLCMRAIDEIEDHRELDNRVKAELLRTVNLSLQAVDHSSTAPVRLFTPIELETYQLAEVTVRLEEWVRLAPKAIAPRIWDATATMAERMAYWAENNWQIRTQNDLDRYTFSVAGAVGLLLSDLWAWYDGTSTDRADAVGFGRGLQAVNILRNHQDDRSRGVDFFPVGWTTETMHAYARQNLVLADSYTAALPFGPARNFCQIPLTLAHATLDVLAFGKEKLSRRDVIALVEQVSQ